MAYYDDRTALIVVDVQNDFADPAGSLYVRDGEQILEAVNAEIGTARASGSLVVFTQDWHPAETPHFLPQGGTWPPHCVQGTWGSEFHPALDVSGEIVRKGTEGEDGYSGFSVRDPDSGETSPTMLDTMLRGSGAQSLVVCGLATDYCVGETVLDARMLGYPVRVVLSAMRAVDLQPEDGERAIARMRDAGAEVA
jgi:nicotinamidase/pyrazinamidase